MVKSIKKKDSKVYKSSKKYVRKNETVSGAGLKKTFRSIVTHAKKHIKKLKPKCKKAAIDLAFAVAKDVAADSNISIPRIIPIPKVGGVLPLVPIFAGLSAAGGLAGGAAGIARAISAIKSAKQRLQELKRHNKIMEEIIIGRGISLKQHGDGLRIYTVNKQKN